MKLWRVELHGPGGGVGRVGLSPAYVVADTADEAYKAVRAWADDHHYGFRDARALRSVELLAEEIGAYGNIGFHAPLFMSKEGKL